MRRVPAEESWTVEFRKGVPAARRSQVSTFNQNASTYGCSFLVAASSDHKDFGGQHGTALQKISTVAKPGMMQNRAMSASAWLKKSILWLFVLTPKTPETMELCYASACRE